MDHIGIDLHKRESQICIRAEEGELIERRIRTEPRRFAEALGGRAPAQVLPESSTESDEIRTHLSFSRFSSGCSPIGGRRCAQVCVHGRRCHRLVCGRNERVSTAAECFWPELIALSNVPHRPARESRPAGRPATRASRSSRSRLPAEAAAAPAGR